MVTTCINIAPYGERTASTEVHPNGFTSSDEPQYMVTFSDFFATGTMAQTAQLVVGGITTAAIPPFGDTVGSYVLLGKTARRHQTDKRIWIVTCTYRIPLPSEEARNGRTEWAVDVAIQARPYEKEKQFWVGINPITDTYSLKNPMQNTGGDPITGVMETLYDEEIVVSVSRTNIPYSTYDLCKGKSNLNALDLVLDRAVVNPRTFPAGTLLLDHWDMTMRPDVDGGNYPRIVLHFIYRVDGWYQQIANKGCRYNANAGLDGEPILPRDIFTNSGLLVTEPQYLHEDGSVAAVGDQVVWIGDPVKGIAYPQVAMAPAFPWALLA